MNYVKMVAFIAFGFFIGLTAGLTFLRTVWTEYEIDFFFWWSIMSTIIGVVFLMGNVGQYVALVKEKDLIQKEKEIHKSQVKVWQHHAEGITKGLFLLIHKGFTSVDDMKTSVESIQQVANSLSTSLNEERLFSDEEIKAKQIKREEEDRKIFEQARAQRGN